MPQVDTDFLKEYKTTEIDLILIHRSGIYVIESKNYSGYIYGDMYSSHWMQILRNNRRYRFYNPILQNKTHIEYLSKLLRDVNDNYIYSLIVFSDRCSLRKIELYQKDAKVIKINDLQKKPTQYDKK